MKWALLSDIHANIQALDACEQHAQRQGVERMRQRVRRELCGARHAARRGRAHRAVCLVRAM